MPVMIDTSDKSSQRENMLNARALVSRISGVEISSSRCMTLVAFDLTRGPRNGQSLVFLMWSDAMDRMVWHVRSMLLWHRVI